MPELARSHTTHSGFKPLSSSVNFAGFHFHNILHNIKNILNSRSSCSFFIFPDHLQKSFCIVLRGCRGSWGQQPTHSPGRPGNVLSPVTNPSIPGIDPTPQCVCTHGPGVGGDPTCPAFPLSLASSPSLCMSTGIPSPAGLGAWTLSWGLSSRRPTHPLPRVGTILYVIC